LRDGGCAKADYTTVSCRRKCDQLSNVDLRYSDVAWPARADRGVYSTFGRGLMIMISCEKNLGRMVDFVSRVQGPTTFGANSGSQCTAASANDEDNLPPALVRGQGCCCDVLRSPPWKKTPSNFEPCKTENATFSAGRVEDGSARCP
jgi:hypothetical protein